MILLTELSKLNWSNASIVLMHLGLSQFDKLFPFGYHLCFIYSVYYEPANTGFLDCCVPFCLFERVSYIWVINAYLLLTGIFSLFFFRPMG